MGFADVDYLRTEELRTGVPRVMARWLVAMVFVGVIVPAGAHQADTSYLKLEAGSEGIHARFSFDVVTLMRIVPEGDAPAVIQAW